MRLAAIALKLNDFFFGLGARFGARRGFDLALRPADLDIPEARLAWMTHAVRSAPPAPSGRPLLAVIPGGRAAGSARSKRRGVALSVLANPSSPSPPPPATPSVRRVG